MAVDIPDKRYFKIGEVSKLAGVVPHVLRYWESEFEAIQPDRARSNQRLYKREDVELILKVKSLLHEQGYTISGARHFLTTQADSDLAAAEPSGPPPLDHQQVHSWLQTIKTELNQLQALLKQEKE